MLLRRRNQALALRPACLARRGRVGTLEVGGPVGLPRVVVVRERLLPSSMLVVELVPRKADLDRATPVLVFAVELAVVAIEAPDHRRVQRPGRTADPVDRPLALRE